MKKLLLVTALIYASAFIFVGCGSKEKTESEVTSGANAEAPVEQTPMSYEAGGSDTGKIAGLFTVNFDYDKASLTSDAKKKLTTNAEWMKTNAKTTIQVEGHCDARGSIEYNLSLGERRAQAVKNYLVGLGVPAARLTIISYGKEKLMDPADSEEAHAKNRRANFVPMLQ